MLISPEHKRILSTQSESKTLAEWVSYFDNEYTKNQIYSYCYHNNYKIKKPSKSEKPRKWNINQDYFKTWSSNMAYVLGLWFANGCIYGGKIFDITLHAKDKYILKKVAKELNYEGNLYDYVDRQSARLNFSCIVIYNDLVALSNKEFPEVPDEYLADFIRGYFDGKGNVTLLKNNRLNSVFASENKKFLDLLFMNLRNKIDIKGGSYDPSSLSIRFGKRDTIKIGEFIYKNDPELFLLRKRQKFISFL